MTIYSPKHPPKRFYVYAYLRQDNTPYYIGKGKQTRAWSKHDGGIHPPKDKTKIVILEANLTNLGALAIERRMIRWYGRKDLETGILRNLTDGGDGSCSYIATQKTREKISMANSGRKLKPRTKEHSVALSKSLVGRKLGDDQLKKLKGRVPWNKGVKGYLTQTNESNLKRSESLKGRVPWNKGKSPTKETLEKQQAARIGKKRGPYKRKRTDPFSS